MKKNLELLKWEPKRGKNGEYVRFQTNEGWMSCFDKVPIDALKDFEGKIACVEVSISQGKNFKGEETTFTNITKCYGEAEEMVSAINQQPDEKPEVVRPGEQGFAKSMASKVAALKPNGQATMYTSYAKDIFCALTKEIPKVMPEEYMKTAIELVKQAKEAFE